jgi:hypothetical protein
MCRAPGLFQQSPGHLTLLGPDQPPREHRPESFRRPSFTGAFPTVAVSGITTSGPDGNGDLTVAIDGLYVGQLSDPFTLHEAATCNYPMEKLRKGLRLVVLTDSDLVETAHPNQLNTNESYIWLLDSGGSVTFDMNQTGEGFATLADVLAGFGLPDTAIDRPTGNLVPSGYLLIVAALALVAIRRRPPLRG